MWTNSPEGPCPASACCQGEKTVTWASPFWVLETRFFIFTALTTLHSLDHSTPCSENFYDTLGLLHQYHTFFLAFKFCPGGSSLTTTITLLCNISLSSFPPSYLCCSVQLQAISSPILLAELLFTEGSQPMWFGWVYKSPPHLFPHGWGLAVGMAILLAAVIGPQISI